ncbi:hypothetical protein SMITH_216 [Smithella sp. ME-1]|uniref:Uncharacterized protein n=1 Tax=hydrocarbon metagenome TaxID=938273 RepID=A0A0W8FNJ5_9ZZZZ|nr:hypothetical protein SMITH_216 [Smithella sp. ME-1]
MDNYTFMRMGNLYQATIDLMIAACKRFGAENAELAISTIGDAINEGSSFDEICNRVLAETSGKVVVAWEDIPFVTQIIRAENLIKEAIEDLNKAIKIKTEDGHVKK